MESLRPDRLYAPATHINKLPLDKIGYTKRALLYNLEPLLHSLTRQRSSLFLATPLKSIDSC